MSDEPTAPFTFRPAPAKPMRTRKTKDEMAEQAMHEETRAVALGLEPKEVVKRKRRTRAEMVQTSAPGDDMAVLKACLKQLRSLPIETAARVVATLEVVFK